MLVSRQSDSDTGDRGPRARTRRLMLETASRLMQAGQTPSVSEVAEAAEVSRATAYRYFPSQAALTQAVVGEALGPILTWTSQSNDAAKRVSDLIATAMPRIEAHEATFKAALKLSLEQWARRQAGTLGEEAPLSRGHRIELLRHALAPLRGEVPAKDIDRLAQALSLVFGVEVLVVLKDIWGVSGRQAERVALWAARALVEATLGQTQAAKGASG